MKTALVGFNAKYIHKNLALRWIYVAKPEEEEAEIFEFTINDRIERTLERVCSYQPDVIGISVYIWNVEYVKEWIGRIHELLPLARIVLGGPEVTYENDEWFRYPIDAILQGEGEITFWQYVKHEPKIDGLKRYQQEPEVPYAKVPISFLETLQSPYFLPMDTKDMDKRYLYVETSRGCPYRCSYCLASLDNQVRMFSDEYLFQLFDRLEQSNVKQVKFLDRTFNVKPQRALAIAKRLSKMPKEMSFQFEVVAETLSKELLAFFLQEENKQRFRFEIGLQTFHQPALQAVGRSQNNEKLVGIIEQMRDHQCVMHVDLIAGLPQENYLSFQETFRRLFALHIDEIQVGILKLLKGTRLKQQTSEYSIQYTETSPYTITSNAWMSQKEIEEVDLVAHAVEKCWNSKKLTGTIRYMEAQGYDTYQLFLEAGKRLKELEHPYQMWQLYDIFWQLSKEKDLNFQGILMMDYYGKFKQRPKRWLPFRIMNDQKEQIYQRMMEYGVSKQDLYHYAILDVGYDKGQWCYQCIIYNSQQDFPKRYVIDQTLESVNEVEE